jgi:hypothetical protein
MNIPINNVPNVGVLLVSRDRDPNLIKKRLNEISDQEFKTTRVIACVKRPEFVAETIQILSEYKEDHNIEYNVVQLYEFDNNDLEIVDECYRYNLGYLAIFESDKEIPKNCFSQLDELLKSDKGVFYIGPYKGEELHGMTIHCKAFKLLNGNKFIVHPDGTRDNRKYAERVRDLTQLEGLV